MASLPEGTLAAVMEAITQAEAPTEYSAGGHRDSGFDIDPMAGGGVGFMKYEVGDWKPSCLNNCTYGMHPVADPTQAGYNGIAGAPLFELHVHGSAFNRGYVMGPSEADEKAAGGTMNIVISMANKRVYFYDGSQKVSVSLNQFLRGIQ